MFGSHRQARAAPVFLTDYRIAAGRVALGAIGLLIGGAFAGLIVEGASDWTGVSAAFNSYLFRVAGFTLWQAFASTLLSVGPALLIARAFSRHPDFCGRRWLIGLFAVPLGLPAIVAALGILALLGRAGYFAGLWSWFSGSDWPGIYGLSGILIAHVFFNLPLATRLFLEALNAVNADQWRLASQLGMNAGSAFRLIEWPALRASLPGVAGLVFMLCITSFTLVLTLGGGPRATTLEVAIYQALRFDFDPTRAAALTLLQIMLTATVIVVLTQFGTGTASQTNLTVARRRFIHTGRAETLVNTALIALGALFVTAPLAAIAASGLNADFARLAMEPAVHRAVLTSLVLAFLAAMASVALSYALAAARSALQLRRPNGLLSLFEFMAGTGAGFVLVVPPIVIGAGWFILLHHIGDVFLFAPVMVIMVNAIMAMPFALRTIQPAHDAASQRHERLCAQLGVGGWNRIRLVELPVLRRPLVTAFAFAMALSLGDLGVIALFGSNEVQTLPYLLFQRMGSYRTADAAGLALLLGLICLMLMLAANLAAKERI